MKAKPDPKQLKRAAAQLHAEHEPRRLNGIGERRLSIADENIVVDQAHRRNGQTTRADLARALANITDDLEHVKATFGQAAPGDHRGYWREIEHGLKGLQRAL